MFHQCKREPIKVDQASCKIFEEEALCEWGCKGRFAIANESSLSLDSVFYL